MNREIKFRMWHKKSKKMFDVESINFKDRSLNIWNSVMYTLSTFSLDDVILMQYTGLHDKNGKEIYEGDILKGTFYGFPMPEYDYAFQIYWDEKEKGFMASYFEPSECEVIGNVYDNPELLGGE